MTAAMVMKLVQAGKLSLHERLAHFYPAIPGAKKITLENLLTMTAGLDLKPGARLGRKHFVSDRDNLACNVKKTVFKPKMLGKWYYSSLNYVYLCGIMTLVTGQSYEQLFRATYVKPLQLKHTEFLWSKPGRIIASRLVPGMIYRGGRYDVVKHKKALQAAHDELGAGSVVMSNHDLAKVMNYILAGGLLNKKSRQKLYRAKPPAYYNGGFYNDASLGLKTANGAGEGYYTFLRSTKTAKTMIIIQANKTRLGDFDRLKPEIDKIMLQLLKKHGK